MYFDTLTRRVEIEGTLRCVTGLRIGAGKDSLDISSTDLPVQKDPLGRPFIPGSSIKGVVRSALEALLRGLDPPRAWACDPFLDPCVDPKEDRRVVDRMKLAERAKRQRDRAKDLCRICKTFGAQSYASHVLFRDARASGRVHVQRRDGVSIDRDLGRYSANRKYDFEVVAAGSAFNFGVTLEATEAWQEGLLVLGLALLDEGHARLGGFTSRGLGLVKLEDVSLKILDVATLRRGKLPERGALPYEPDKGWDLFRREALAAWDEHVTANPGAKQEAPAC